jgi:septal ring factor EnvC (AmiA/AmiB activator)
MISANRLEPMVWDMIVRVLLDPHSLRAGYEEALAQEAEKRERNTANLEALHRKVAKLKQQQQNLTAAYTDPDISITKSEYLTQRTKIDDELSEVSKMITELEKELADGPNPADREAMEAFGAQVRESINTHETLTPDVKREILKQLHVKVILGLNGTARLESWFRPVSTGLSSTSSTCQVIQDGATE